MPISELHFNLQYISTQVSLLQKWFRAWLYKKLPYRAKRMMFLASLFGYFLDKKTPSPLEIERLNYVMDLHNNHDAILFPIHIYKSLWKSLDTYVHIYTELGESFNHYAKRRIREGHPREIGEIVFRHAPYWMLYADRETIVNDVAMLVMKTF